MNKEEILLKTKAMSVLWIAFLIASLVYIFISFYLLKNPLKSLSFNSLSITLIVIGFLNLFIGMSIYKKTKSILIKSKTRDLEQLISKLFTLNIIAWALIESSAAIGLVLSILEKNTNFILLLALPALFAIFLSPPKPQILKEILKEKF